MNAVKPSIGVPFGPASVQTATFQGVYAKDLLTHCGLHMWVVELSMLVVDFGLWCCRR